MTTFDLGIIDKILDADPANPPQPYTLVVLNSPTPHAKLQQYLQHASQVICADGAANFVSQLTQNYYLIGDLDSCSEDVQKASVSCQKDPDEYSTDCEKCLNYVLKQQKDHNKSEMIICYNCWGGRMDHCLYNVYLCKKYLNIMFVDDLNICFTCTGKNRIVNPREAKYYGFFPYQDCHCKTEGLVWDVDQQVSWTGLVSACNFCEGPQWTIESNKEMFVIVAW